MISKFIVATISDQASKLTIALLPYGNCKTVPVKHIPLPQAELLIAVGVIVYVLSYSEYETVAFACLETLVLAMAFVK